MSFFGALRWNCFIKPMSLWPLVSMTLALGFLGGPLDVPQAHAQEIVTTVNGAPITDLDIAQRMKLLRVLRQPASHQAALNSLIDDSLMLQETRQYQVRPTDAEIGGQIVRTANAMKIAPQTLLAEIEAAGVSPSNYKEHFSAVLAFDSLVQAFHKGVEPSETQINAELAREGGRSAAGTEYSVRQVIFVVPHGAGFAGAKGRMEAAQQLRLRFTDCASGVPIARAMDNVAVKEEVTRNSLQLNPAMKKLLDSTPVGHLTPPQMTIDGVEMLAVCNKSASSDESAIRQEISRRILDSEIEAAAAKRLKELRAHAIIVNK